MFSVCKQQPSKTECLFTILERLISAKNHLLGVDSEALLSDSKHPILNKKSPLKRGFFEAVIAPKNNTGKK